MRMQILALLTGLLLVVLFGCSKLGTDPSEGPTLAKTPVGPSLAPLPPTYCSTSQCIRGFLDDLPCDGGSSRADLFVAESGSSYTLGSHHIVDGCKPPYGPEVNWWAIIGGSSTNRPTIQVPGSPCYDCGPVLHAGLHIVENIDPTKPNLIQDMVFDVSSHMGGGTVPGIQFEANSLEIDNAEFTGSGTTHFLAPGTLEFDALTIASNHEFVIGREYWCGVLPPDVCHGPPPVLPKDGSAITNSSLYGKFIIDCIYPGTTSHTITFSDNNPIAKLDLDIELLGTVRPVAVLTDNVFTSTSGAKVIIKGDYEVVATGNETFQGPCPSDALADFDVSGVSAGNTNALTLNSYVYDGDTYLPDEEEIIFSEIYMPGPLCNTAYVRFIVKGTHTTGKVRWGGSGCTNTVNTTVVGDTHYASFNVAGLNGVYWRVESTFCQNTDATACTLKKRPKTSIYGCPPPPWWPF